MVFLFVLLILMIIIIIFLFSKIVIKVDDLQISSENLENNHLNNNYNIRIKLIILNIIPVFWININNKKLQKLKSKNRINKTIFKKLIKKIIKLVKIKRFYLKLNIGSDFQIINSILIPLLSTVISMLLTKNKVRREDYYYEINSNYNLGNTFKIQFCGMFYIKIIDIIKIYTYI